MWKLPYPRFSVDGKQVSVQLDVIRDYSGQWKVCTGSILIHLNRCNRQKKTESTENLGNTLRKANLPYFCEFRNKMVVRPERIEKFLAQQIEPLDVWEPLPTSNK
jgi:hypothetical protein